jgi:hypothetical protein
MMYDLEKRIFMCQMVKQLARPIRRSVIHNHDFVIIRQRGEQRGSFMDYIANGTLIVISREKG